MTRQRSMRWAALVGLIVGGVGVFFAVRDDRQRWEESERTASERKLFRFDPKDVRAIALTNGKGTVKMKRSVEGRFVVLAPEEWPADPEAIKAVLTCMAGLWVEGDPITNDPALYGLDQPSIRVDIDLADKTAMSLRVGEGTALKEHVFATASARNGVLRLRRQSVWPLDREPRAYMAKTVFQMDREDIRRIVVADGKNNPRFDLEKKGGEVWGVTAEGRTLKADPFVVERFLVRLSRDLKVDSLTASVADDHAKEDGPRERPSAEFVVTLTDANQRQEVARFGRTRDGASFAWRDGFRSLATVPDDVLQDFDRGLSELRDHTICQFAPASVQRIEFRASGSEPFVVERAEQTPDTSEGWRFSPPVSAMRPSGSKVDHLVLVLSTLFSERVHEDLPSPDAAREIALGLSPAHRQVRVLAATGSVLCDVRVGGPISKDEVAIVAAGLDRLDAISKSKLTLFPSVAREIAK